MRPGVEANKKPPTEWSVVIAGLNQKGEITTTPVDHQGIVPRLVSESYDNNLVLCYIMKQLALDEPVSIQHNLSQFHAHMTFELLSAKLAIS